MLELEVSRSEQQGEQVPVHMRGPVHRQQDPLHKDPRAPVLVEADSDRMQSDRQNMDQRLVEEGCIRALWDLVRMDVPPLRERVVLAHTRILRL